MNAAKLAMAATVLATLGLAPAAGAEDGRWRPVRSPVEGGGSESARPGRPRAGATDLERRGERPPERVVARILGAARGLERGLLAGAPAGGRIIEVSLDGGLTWTGPEGAVSLEDELAGALLGRRGLKLAHDPREGLGRSVCVRLRPSAAGGGEARLDGQLLEADCIDP